MAGPCCASWLGGTELESYYNHSQCGSGAESKACQRADVCCMRGWWMWVPAGGSAPTRRSSLCVSYSQQHVRPWW